MANSNNVYLKDFIDVLEDSPPNVATLQIPTTKPISVSSPKSTRRNVDPLSASYRSSKNDTEMLKLKVEQSIKNSLKIINKVKGIS
jgi:hypothetical protein